MLIYVLACILILTLLFFERQRIYEHVLRKKKWAVVSSAFGLVIVMTGFSTMLTQPGRETTSVVKTVQAFLNLVKNAEFEKAYEGLSEVSKQTYTLQNFVRDQEYYRNKLKDYRIDEVTFNQFDERKAVVQVSSPFLIYGQDSIPFELVKEDAEWKLVFSPKMLEPRIAKPQPNGKKKKESGVITGFFKKLF